MRAPFRFLFSFFGINRPANSSTICLDMVGPARLHSFILCLTMRQLKSAMFPVPAKFSPLFLQVFKMPKVKSRSRTSRAPAGAQKRASPRASVRASSVATRGLSVRTTMRSPAPVPGQASATPVTSQDPLRLPQPEQLSQPDALLSPQIMEALITRVVDEVSCHLSPAENPASLPPTVPSALQEVPVTTAATQSSSSTAAPDAIATSVVQGSLATASATVMGLIPSTSDGPPQVPGQCFQSVALPVDAHVTDKLREKIWKDEYIDFGSLLANPAYANRYQLAVQNPESGPLPSLCIEPITKAKKITSIESWLNCFHTRQFPHEAPALMKYCDTVQDLAVRGHNWKYYDENFRFLRQAHCSALPWDQIHDELWLKSNQVTQPRPFQTTSQGRVPGKVDTTPKGYRFRFHKGRKCAPGCAYKHQCYKCEGSHPVSNCNFRGQSKQSSCHPSTARSQSSHPANTRKS